MEYYDVAYENYEVVNYVPLPRDDLTNFSI